LIAIRKWQQGASELDGSFIKVKKVEIAQSGQYILAGNRFKTSEVHSISSYPIVEIGDVAKLHTGGTPQSTRREYYGGSIKWLVSGDIHQEEIFDCSGRITDLALRESNAKLLPLNSVLIALNGQGKTRGTVALLRTEATCNQSLVAIETDSSRLLPEFLYFVLRGLYQDIREINGENQRGGLNMPLIRKIRIPLPPIEEQQEYIKILSGFTTVIQGAKQILTNWKPFVPLNSECEIVKISDLVQTITAPRKIPTSDYGMEGALPIIDQSQNPIAGWTDDVAATVFSSEGLIIFGDHTCSIKYADFPFAQGADGIKILKTNKNVIPKFLYYYLLAYPIKSSGYKRHFTEFKELDIKLPSIEYQKTIVESIELEYKSVQNAGELLLAYENRIEQVVSSFWG
jgi:type I restriction enzyme M protein